MSASAPKQRKNAAPLKQAAAMWRAGRSLVEMAGALGVSVHTAGAYVIWARKRLGVRVVPYREGRRGPSPLNRLRKVGDWVVIPKDIAGSPQSIYQNAQTRGWRVKLRDHGDTFLVIAKERTTPLAQVRAAKERSKSGA